MKYSLDKAKSNRSLIPASGDAMFDENQGAEVGIGAKINVGNWDFSAGYDLGIRDDYLSQTGMLKVKYNF